MVGSAIRLFIFAGSNYGKIIQSCANDHKVSGQSISRSKAWSINWTYWYFPNNNWRNGDFLWSGGTLLFAGKGRNNIVEWDR